MTTASYKKYDEELSIELIETAQNLMILFPDLPNDQALLRAQDWVGYFASGTLDCNQIKVNSSTCVR
jgi:hypothetical protein